MKRRLLLLLLYYYTRCVCVIEKKNIKYHILKSSFKWNKILCKVSKLSTKYIVTRKIEINKTIQKKKKNQK